MIAMVSSPFTLRFFQRGWPGRPPGAAGSAGGTGPGRRGNAGFTLMEMMLVLGLISIFMAAVVAGFRSLTKRELRDATTRLASVVRYLFDRASTTGKVHRIVFDFREGKYWAEFSEDNFILPAERETEESRRLEEEAIAEEQRLAAEEAERRSSYGSGEEEVYDVERYLPTAWRPKRASWTKLAERSLKLVQLKKTKIAGLYTPRYAEPVSTGMGYLYFFPLGQTEAAVLHLSDEDSVTFYTLLVHPLNGRVRIENGYIAPQVEEEFDDEGNVVE